MSNKDDFLQESGEFGLSAVADEKPRIVIRNGAKKYVMSEVFDMETFKKFLTDYQAGNVEAYIKSEDIPDNSAPGVKVAVARNFEELVEKTDKDVLVGT